MSQIESGSELQRVGGAGAGAVVSDGVAGPGARAAGGPSEGAGLGKRVGKSVAWMMISSVVTRLLTFGAQIALGYLLFKEDFGLFGIATGIASFVQIFRDGGLRSILVQRGEAGYMEFSGPVFWLALTINSITGLVMAAIAPLAVMVYHEKALLWLLLIAAALVPLSTPLTVMDSKLRIELKFSTLARIQTISGLLRSVTMVAFAGMGLGSLSFMLPMVVCQAYETIATYRSTNDRPWTRAPRRELWWGLFRQSKWLIVTALAGSMVYFSTPMVCGLFVSAEVVGVYFFAASIVLQTGLLIAWNVEQVLLPSLSRLSEEPERQRAAAVRALEGLTLLCAPASLVLGAVFAPLERVVWGGRWEAAVVPLQIASALYPIFILHVLPKSLMTSQGRFRALAITTLVSGAILMLASGLGAYAGKTPEAISLWAGLAQAGVSIWMMWLGLRRLNVSLAGILARVFRVWTPTALVCAGVVWLDATRLNDLHPAVRVLLCGVLAGMGTMLVLRVISTAALQSVLGVMPIKISGPARRLLFLRA